MIFSKIFGWNGQKFFDRLMYWASRSGDGYLYGMLGAILLWMDRHTAAQLIPIGVIAFAIEIPVYLLIKRKVKRCRPFKKIAGIQYLIKPPDEFSFPSGHTAAAFLMATLVSTFYPMLTIPCYTGAAIIGFSRVYNGVHYPTDVLAGAVLGMASVFIGISLIL